MAALTASLRALLARYDGLTTDFWAATMAWRLDLRALKALAKNSLRCARRAPAVRARATARACAMPVPCLSHA